MPIIDLEQVLGYFSGFLNCTNGTKSHKASDVTEADQLSSNLVKTFRYILNVSELNYLSANRTKWSYTFKQFFGNSGQII